MKLIWNKFKDCQRSQRKNIEDLKEEYKSYWVLIFSCWMLGKKLIEGSIFYKMLNAKHLEN